MPFIGGVANLIPETGLVTPFLSYGGSALPANYLLVALLLIVSDHFRRPPRARPSMPLAEASAALVTGDGTSHQPGAARRPTHP